MEQRAAIRRFVIAGIAVAIATAGFVAFIAFRVGGSRVTAVGDDVVELAAAWLAAAVCGWRWRRSPSGLRRFWAFMGVSSFAWGAGEAVWCYYEVWLTHKVPFPSLADVGFLAAVPFAIVALLSIPTSRLSPRLRIRLLLDGGLMASSLLFVSWATVLGPTYRAHEGGVMSQALSLAYPACDIVIATVALLVAIHVRRSGRVVLAFVGAGVIALALADSSFAYFTELNSFGIGNLLDTGWVAGYLLITLGALWPGEIDLATGDEDDATTRLSALIPYVPALAALAVALIDVVQHHPLGTVLAWDGFALVLFLGGRQLMALMENVSLGRRLAAKVKLRGHQLEQRDARFAALVRRSSDLTTILSANGAIEYQSPSASELLGHETDELTGADFSTLLHPDDAATWLYALTQVTIRPDDQVVVEWRFRTLEGKDVPVETRVSNLLDDPNVVGIVMNSRDVSERKRLEEELRHQAFHDPLTGLANRALFRDRLEHALALRERHGGNVGLLFVDLDDFKAINDGRSHAVGDELLQAVGRRIRATVRVGDTVARLGGDEFAVLVDGWSGESTPADTADRVLDELRLPFLLVDGDVLIQASIGIATADGPSVDAGELLRSADVAMYSAKRAGKGRREVFHPGLQVHLMGHLQLEADIRGAVKRQEFVVHYQPIVDLGSSALVGVESLMRWQHPGRGLIGPLEFIPAAEANGLIVQMGSWLLHQACRDAKAWQEEAEMPGLGLSVNLSIRQLDDANLIADVVAALGGSGLDPATLTLEVTESMLMADPAHSIAVLTSLRGLGVKVAIDDFGTGYSSLSYLQRLPVDELKIDRSFVIAMDDGSDASAALVRSIVGLARDFHLKSVAEGIETEAQRASLLAAGCQLGQGFLFAKPADAASIRRALLKSVMADRAAAVAPRRPAHH